MLHVGDYVFLIAISASVYFVSLRLLQLLNHADENDHSQTDVRDGVRGAQQ